MHGPHTKHNMKELQEKELKVPSGIISLFSTNREATKQA